MSENQVARTEQWAAEWRDYINGIWVCSVPGCSREPQHRIVDAKSKQLLGYACSYEYPKSRLHLESMQRLCSGHRIMVTDVELWG